MRKEYAVVLLFHYIKVDWCSLTENYSSKQFYFEFDPIQTYKMIFSTQAIKKTRKPLLGGKTKMSLLFGIGLLAVALAVFAIVVLIFSKEVDQGIVRERSLHRYCYTAVIELEKNVSETVLNGIIISPTKILTQYDRLMIRPQYFPKYLSRNITVRVGSIDRFNGGIIQHVSNVERIPYPNKKAWVDLAVLTLNESLPFGPTICSIRLAEMEDEIYTKNGSIVEINGYNYVPSYKNSPKGLQWMKSPIIMGSKCHDVWIKRLEQNMRPKMIGGKIFVFPRYIVPFFYNYKFETID